MNTPSPPAPSRDPKSVRLDSFLYRHRVAEVMRGPVVTVAPDTSLAEASRVMIRQRIGSLVVADSEGRARGIATERDFLRALAETGMDAAATPISRIMSVPVKTIAEDAALFVAMGRMPRLGINHLVVVDGRGLPVGVISASTLMRLRSAETLIFGDEVAAAETAQDLARAFHCLPALAQGLLAEGADPLVVVGAISAIYRDMTGRAAEIAANSMRADGWGDPPAPWCVLILGSGGRGESGLAPDQDNAIVHAGSDADDAWFAEAGARMARTLDDAGLPYCKGGVMAKNPEWRRTEAGWRDEIGRWIRKKEGEALLSVDIFFDFAPAFGERTLADALRRDALAAAQRSPLFLRLLAAELENRGSAIGPLGFLRTEQGRVDIKRGGTMPIVAAARVMALKHGVTATGTRERLTHLVGSGVLGADDADRLSQALGVLTGLMLEQQIADLGDRRAPSTRIDPKRLTRPKRQALKAALRACENTAAVVQGPLSQTLAISSGAS